MRNWISVVAAGSTLVIAAPASADRPPDAKERAAVEKVLRANGFVSWEEIELDDDGPRWEIDDARTSDAAQGRFDVKIDPGTMKIVRRERDD
jgi:hypothetical protein